MLMADVNMNNTYIFIFWTHRDHVDDAIVRETGRHSHGSLWECEKKRRGENWAMEMQCSIEIWKWC